MTWFYKLIAAILALFIYSPTSEIATYSVIEKAPQLTFTVLADVHIEGNNEDRFELFGEGIRDINSAEDKSDALIFLGDNTMNGQVIEQSALFGLLNKYNKIENILMVAGNHELCPSDYNVGEYEGLRDRFIKYYKAFTDIETETLYHSAEINGYRFIILGSEADAGLEQKISDEQFLWLENELKSAEESGKPVFIFNHWPLNNVWEDVWSEGHIGEGSDRLYELLKSCDTKILYFSGHLHMGFYEDKREVVYDDNVTFINVAGFGVDNDVGDAQIQQNGTGQQVEVYEDEVIIRVRDFAKHEWMNIEYTVEL